MRTFLYILFLFSLLGCSKKKNQKELAKKPNVIIILTDDQGWGDLSYNGNRNLQTPNIDSLAINGVSFENFYVSPVCSPTRAEILTGRYFPRMGVYSTSAGGERFNFSETTIADVFKKAGYATAAYGKWHSGSQPPYHPNSRGFDDYYGFASGHWGNYFSPMLEHNGKPVKGNGYLPDDLIDKSIAFISKNKKTPFFLYIPLNIPHSPMQVPEKYWSKMKDKELLNKYLGTEKEDITFTKAALAMMENVDWNVGRITQTLKKLELEEHTIIVFLSDNGPNGWRWNGGMKGKKGSTDEGGVKSPLFIQWKNHIPKDKSVSKIASSIDLLPTLASLAGIDFTTTNEIDGKNLKSLLLEESPKWEPRAVYNHWKGKTSIRTQKYRLAANNELFDMEQDLGQTKDLSTSLPHLTDSLKTLRANWIKEVTPINDKDDRLFPVGHPNYIYTHLPARDGVPHGNIKRSNQYPNDSYFTNWNSLTDKITWDIEVLEDGVFEIEIFYTCAKENVGSAFEISFNNSKLTANILEGHDPPLTGMTDDRIPRIESYVKDFRSLKIGEISLKKGEGTLVLKALKIAHNEVMDFRLLTFKKVK
ncbi:MAG: N-acetylgalactosamine 6-sulfate sulfatase [Flavobacteriaceae bacterium]|nr:MAG: N-acetylgalactosamine 6-sulfate sulfatase [Flavobacteriaceae bacterium]